MAVLRIIGLLALAIVCIAFVVGLIWARRDAQATERAWRLLNAPGVDGVPEHYDPEMVAMLPPVARRYFARAIAPGTPLVQRVRISMEGEFLMQGRSFAMWAEQIIAPPHGFVWKARMGGGLVRFSGSDGWLAEGESWTRFRLWGLVPLVRAGQDEDHARASITRMLSEIVWTPAALLPQAGAVWRETGPDQAEVRFPAFPEVAPITLRLDADGHVIAVSTMRWSDANPAGVYQLQPFGGRMTAQETQDGFTVPVEVEVGNFFGTPDYVPFFRARVIALDRTF